MPYSPEKVAEIKETRSAVTRGLQIQGLELYELSAHLKSPGAQNYVNQGIGRRLKVILRCVHSIFEIFPPDRTAFLSREELSDVDVCLNAFVVNIYGLIDNIAWTCALESGLADAWGRRTKIGLFKPLVQPCLPPKLSAYLALGTTKRWFDEYAVLYRDSAVHRIPPYLPPKVFSPDDAARYQVLEQDKQKALYEDLNTDLFDQISAEQDRLGTPSLFMAVEFAPPHTRGPVYLHPQILVDCLTIKELLSHFVEGMRAHYRIPAPGLNFETLLDSQAL